MGVANATLFGEFGIRIDDKVFGPGDLGGPKPKELLQLLLMARGAAVSKDVLADRLWGDKLPKNVAGTLETYVSGLRKRLFSEKSTARSVLSTTSNGYQFRLDGFRVDLLEFDQLADRADRGGPDALQLRLKAATLSVGDLLEDASTAGWIQAEREIYRNRVARNLVLASEELVERGRYSAALPLAERAMQIQPYAEEAVRVVMLANHGLGQDEIARQVFERCRSVLADELNRDTTTETETLAGMIDAGASMAELLPGAAPGPSLVPLRREDAGSAVNVPFVGREAEMSRALAAVELSHGGRFTLVLVRGAPGVGRTAFLGQLATRCSGRIGYAAVPRDACEQPGLPLADVLVDALSEFGLSADARAYADAPLLSGEPQALEMLAELLAAAGPSVLLIDDLQWADNGTLIAVEWLRRSYPDLPVTIVATVRDGRAERSSASDLLAAQLNISLEPPTADEWCEVDGVDRSLVEFTGGYPRLMCESLGWQEGGQRGIAPAVRAAILRSTRGLDALEQRLLQLGSVANEPFGPFDVGQDVGLSPVATLDALCGLVEAGILRRVGAGFAFRLPVAREVISSTVVGGARRVGLEVAARAG